MLWSMYPNIDSSFNAVIFFLKDLNFRLTLRVFPFRSVRGHDDVVVSRQAHGRAKGRVTR